MKNFFVVTNPSKDRELENTKRIQNYLTKAGCNCKVYVNYKGEVESGNIGNWDVPSDTECILVLGGDGTLIEAARDTVDPHIPLLGINLGTLGFLVEVERTGIEYALTLLMQDKYEIEKRMMLDGWLYRSGTYVESSNALNDIVITRCGSLQIIHYHIYVNGQFLNAYNADGVIISTPTGSTGYNMSAGGPIVEPKAKLLVVTPICPHTLNTRSIVLSAEDEVVIEMTSGKKDIPVRAEVNFDGGHMRELFMGDKVVIKKSDKMTDIVKISQASFLEVLHKKMSEN